LRDSLKKRDKILPESEIPKIFSNIEQIFAVHSELLTQMDILLEQGIEQSKLDSILTSIGKTFAEMCEHFKVYAEYCCNSPKATETLSQCSKNPAYIAYEDLTRKSTGKLRLDAFIAKPVQRICKYPLFFKYLLKNTKPEDGCSEVLKKAYNSLEAVATYINDYKREKENAQKLKAIQKILKKYKKKIEVPSRFFYKESVMTKLKPNGKKQIRRVFLFNDMVMYVREKSSTNLEYRGSITLSKAMLRIHPTLQHTFQMRTTEREKKIYTFVCKNEFELQDWIKELRKLLEEADKTVDASLRATKKLIESSWK